MADTDPPRRPRGRRPKDGPSGRDLLLSAAVGAFALRGYDGVDLRSLADGAGVDAGLVRVHFGSKEGLWHASVLHLAQELAPLNAQISSLALGTGAIEKRLTEAVGLMVEFGFEHPEFGHFFAQQAAERGERLEALSEHLVSPGYRILQPLLQQAAEAGSLRATDPVMAFAVLIGALMFTTRSPGLVEPLQPDAGDLRRRLVDSLVSMLLTDGIRKDGSHVSY